MDFKSFRRGSAAAVALALAGCGGMGRSDRATDAPATPASYDIISADRTRGRDDLPAPASNQGVDVQAAYEHARRADRAQRQAASTGDDTQPSAAAGGPAADAVGGTSAGSDSAGAATPAIPYAGSRQIGEPLEVSPSAAPEQAQRAPEVRASGGADHDGQRTFGIPDPRSEDASQRLVQPAPPIIGAPALDNDAQRAADSFANPEHATVEQTP